MAVELGRRFINLEEVIRTDRSITDTTGALRGLVNIAALFGQALETLRASAPFGGGIVLFPEGVTLLLGHPDEVVRSTIFIPEDVQLWFAPNGKLRLGKGVTLVIEGTVRARPEAIFAGVDTDPATPDRGKVIFASERTLEVRPEWWDLPLTTDTDAGRTKSAFAMQDCLDAIHRHRHLGGRRAAVALRWSAVYATDRPITVGRLGPEPSVASAVASLGGIEPNREGVWIEGGTISDPIGLKAFRPASGRRIEAVLTLDSVQGSRVEGVSVDAEGWWAEVALRLLNGSSSATGEAAGTLNVFRRCRIEGVRRALVEIGARPGGLVSGPFEPIGAAGPATQDHSGTLFDQCLFVARLDDRLGRVLRGELTDPTYGSFLEIPLSEAIYLRASGSRPVSFRLCGFETEALANLRIESGSVLLDGCVSQNNAPRNSLWRGETASQPDRRNRATPGVDLFLADPTVGGAERSAALGRVTLLQHEDQSRQLLDTFRGMSATGAGPFAPNVVVVNSHTNDANDPPWVHETIRWDGPGRPSMALSVNLGRPGGLYLLHDQFGLRVPPTGVPDAVQGRIVVNTAARFVFDLGSHISDIDQPGPGRMTLDDILATVTDTNPTVARVSLGFRADWLRRLTVVEPRP